MLARKRKDLVLVDERGVARDAVVDDGVEPAREVHLKAVREVAPVVEPEREHGVTRLDQRGVDRHVRLSAGVRLDVRVLGAEQLLRAVDRELLDLVHHLAAAVVATTRIALGVLVGENRAGCLEHGRPGEVLRRDQLDLAALAVGLPADQHSDLGIVLREPPGPQTLEVVGGNCHSRILLARCPGALVPRCPGCLGPRCLGARLTTRKTSQALEDLRGGDGALAEHARRGAGEVDHGRRDAR